jgi:RNA polymerase sigma-70 factor (ECF subfamily)
MRWRVRSIRELCESAPGEMGKGLFWRLFGAGEGPWSARVSGSQKHPSGAEARFLSGRLFGTTEVVPCSMSGQRWLLAGDGLAISWPASFGPAMARRADDPKFSGKKGSGTGAGAGAAKGVGAGYGEGAEPEEDIDRDTESDPENEGFAQHSGDDGVEDDMATLVLDNSGLGPAPGSVLNPASGQGAVVNAPDAPRVNYAEDESSDAAVMLRVAAGDEAGFNYLVGKYHRAMISFLFRMVHNQAVAEELAQEVFLRVYRSRESYRAEAKFTTWLYRIATNLAVNHARDTKHERSAQNIYLDAPDEESGTTPDVADDTPTVEQTLLRDERMAAIRAHVMELPERQRMAVLMHKYQGMDYRQIGEVLKLSESATKSLLFRAYQTLREKLKDFV